MDDIRIDSHKLIYHPDRVAQWQQGKKIFPINMEICLTGACNHRCVFCCCDYLNYKADMLDYDNLVDNLREISPSFEPHGLKSVLLAGTGEPLLYPRFIEFVNTLKGYGVDIALSTNGVLFTREKADACLSALSWVRFSVSGGTEETYHRIHRGKEGDLQKVFDNIQYAVELKKKNKLDVVLNVQIVMIPDNLNEIVPLARQVKELGADTFIVKTYGTNVEMKNKIKETVSKDFYTDQTLLREELKTLDDENFTAIYRDERIKNTLNKKSYTECYASPFHAFLASDGGVYPCCNLPGLDSYCFGNMNEMLLRDIFLDRAGSRRDVLRKLTDQKLAPCTAACKLDPMNQYLEKLVHPIRHVNFI